MTDTPTPPDLEGIIGHEGLYRLFFESSSDAFYVIPLAEGGVPGAFVDVNQGACDMLGYSREELLAIAPLDIDEEASETLWRAAHQRLTRRGHDRYYRTHVTRDGRRLPVEISARIFRQEGQTYILAVVRDISERRRADERLKIRQRDLQALVDASLEFSALVKPDTTILRINEVGARRWGSTPEALKGQRIIDLSPSDIAPRRAEVAREVAEQRKTITFSDYRDGLWLENTVSPVVDDAGEVSRFAIFSRDITVAHLSGELDWLFNNIDRDVLSGTPVRALVGYACDHLVRAFRSPLVWFEELVSSEKPGADTPDGMRVCQGRWFREGDDFPQLHQSIPQLRKSIAAGCSTSAPGRLRIVKAADCQGLRLLPAMGDTQPASLALLEIQLPGGHSGILTIASIHAETFDPEPIAALLEHAADRFQVAFELASEQRQLALVKQALKTAHSAVIIADPRGDIVWTNEAFSRYSGYGPGEIGSVRSLELDVSKGGQTEHAPRPVGDPQTDPFQWVMGSRQVWSGEAVVRRRDGASFIVLQTITPVLDSRGEVAHLIAIQEDISKRKLEEERIRYLAEHDALTGLHNRGFLLDDLHRLLVDNRRGRHHNIGFLYLDIDRFKQVNDEHGHAIGDALLIGFAERLRQVVRQGDLVCRIGGDEFVLVLMDIRQASEAEAVAHKLLESLTRPILYGDRALHVTSSIGISLAPGDGETPELLLKKADAAMYEAKRLGRARACFWETLKGLD